MSALAFRYRFMSTYASTALDYASRGAQEASLHEVECLLPYIRGAGNPVYLTGFIFQAERCDLKWWDALSRLQVGGERGYGWGWVERQDRRTLSDGKALFGGPQDAKPGTWPPALSLRRNACLLAHSLAAGFEGRKPLMGMAGPVEPVVGRETKPDTRFGVHLSRARICYVPGVCVKDDMEVQIGPYGIWEAV
jgi:hypothetical protein